MGFEPANIINGATGYDETRALHHTFSALPSPQWPRAGASSRVSRWPDRDAAWGRMETCPVPTVPDAPRRAVARPETVRSGGSTLQAPHRNSTWSAPARELPAAKAHRTGTGWCGP